MTAKIRTSILAYTTGAIAIVAAVGSQVVLAIQAWKMHDKVATVAEGVAVADVKLDKIGKDTDGNFTKANDRIEKLEKMLEERFKPTEVKIVNPLTEPVPTVPVKKP